MRNTFFKLSATLFAFICMCNLSIAQEVSLPNQLVAVTKPNVNVRQAPNNTARILSKASLGTVYELVSNKAGWCEVKEAVTGKTVYISATMAKIFNKESSSYPKTEYLAGGTEDDPAQYEHTKNTSKTSTTETYSFWTEDSKKNTVFANLNILTADTQGRSRGYDYSYKGKQMGWYVVLDEEIDLDGNVGEKLEKPIIVYWNYSGKSGIFVDGVYYKDSGNPFE